MVVGNIYVIASVAVIGGSLFGFDISSMSAILDTTAYKCYFGPPPNEDGVCPGPDSLRQGGITAAMPAGSWLGALVSGYVSDILGRRYAIMAGCIVWIIGSIISCASQNVAMLVVGRVVNGFAVGIESAQVPVYISEVSPPSKRGRLVGAQQWAITWGILIMFYISFGCTYIGGSTPETYSTSVFRIPWGVQMLPAVLLFLGMIFLPESPRWLARHDRWEECHSVLTLIHGKGNSESPIVMTEMQEIREMCEFERQNKDVNYLELFKPSMVNRTLIGLFTQIWSQLTGMNIMMYYITYVFKMAGYSGDSNLIASSIQYIINVVMTIPALIWVDRWGRRPTLLIGATFMMIWMYANAGIMATYGEVVPGGIDGTPQVSMRLHGAPAKGLIASTYLFVASYAITWGPVSWVYPPELYPLRVRGKAVSLATSGNWAFNTALGLFTPVSFANIRWQTYIIFGVFCTAMLIHAFFMFPETAGKTLEEIEHIFTDPNGFPYVGTPAWKTRKHTKAAHALERGDVEAAGKAMIEHTEDAK